MISIRGVSPSALLTAWVFAGAGLAIALTSGHVSQTFATSSDFNKFAAFYVITQGLERLIEVFSPLVPPYGDDDASKKNRAAILGAVTFLIGVAIARWTGLLFLQTIGWTNPSSWLDVIVTGLVVSGGTKALHDLISNLAK